MNIQDMELVECIKSLWPQAVLHSEGNALFFTMGEETDFNLFVDFCSQKAVSAGYEEYVCSITYGDSSSGWIFFRQEALMNTMSAIKKALDNIGEISSSGIVSIFRGGIRE